MQSKIISIFALLIIVLLAGVLAYHMNRDYYINKKMKQVNLDLKTIQIATESLHIDDCGGVDPGENNHLSHRLTTPIAYLSRMLYDPFSPNNEPYKFIQQYGRGNGTMYLIVSRGPDKVWDIDRLPIHMKVPPGMFPPDKAYKVISKYGTSPYERKNWYEGVQSYIVLDGTTTDIPKMNIISLPTGNDQDWMKKNQLIEYLAKQDIAIYDPSNGVISRGDIIYSNVF